MDHAVADDGSGLNKAAAGPLKSCAAECSLGPAYSISNTETPLTEMEKFCASSSNRFSIHSFGLVVPSPSKKARRTHRVMQ
jgi:hypothetical protein